MLRDTLLCRDVISGVSRKVWRHTKFTLDKIDSASEPKKTTRKRVKRIKIVHQCIEGSILVCRVLKSLRTTGLIGYKILYIDDEIHPN